MMAPPFAFEDLYPGHILETLDALSFAEWPLDERRAVVRFFEALGRPAGVFPDEVEGWDQRVAALIEKAVT